jgi:hypothetical protein
MRVILLAVPILAWAVWAAPSQAQPPSVPAAAVAPAFTLTNGQPRLTVDGKVIDAHDGMIAKFGSLYYLYGTAYQCGFRWGDATTQFCGFNVYSSPDLTHWDGPVQVVPMDAYWESLCMHDPAKPGWGCFRPHVVFNVKTQRYVLWVNAPSGFRALTSTNPAGPFTIAGTPHLAAGDMALYADADANGSGYAVYASSGRIFEFLLSDDYLDVVNTPLEITGFPQVAPFYGAEAPSLFNRNGEFYLVLSVPQCPYCSQTGSGYFVAASAFGPWHYQGLLSDRSCDGQPTAVSALDGTYLYQSDQWLQTPNEFAAHQFWGVLAFNGAQILPVTCSVGAYPNLSYLPWYDNSSAGFQADNIHIVNPKSNGQDAVGAVSLPGQMLSFSIKPGGEWVGAFGAGTVGGPVQIGSTVPVIASQRVKFNQSFNELPAQSAAAAAPDLYFPWFDRVSSPGFSADTIHVVNPSAADADVTVTIPGVPGCTSPPTTVAAGADVAFTCRTGFGGPVHVHSTQPVLASQRLTYYQTFSEVNGQPAAGATLLYSTWYDLSSSTLFLADNVHVVAPAGSVAAANVQVTIPGCPIPNVWHYSDSEWIYSCPAGRGFGGPVQVTAAVPVLVSQRVEYGDSFNETAAQDARNASMTLYMPWFDFASSFGFDGDNVHVMSASGSLRPDQVTVTIPGCSPSVWQASPGELVYSCQFGHGFGGPVVVSATTPVLASQRVAYYRSFNETAAHS